MVCIQLYNHPHATRIIVLVVSFSPMCWMFLVNQTHLHVTCSLTLAPSLWTTFTWIHSSFSGCILKKSSLCSFYSPFNRKYFVWPCFFSLREIWSFRTAHHVCIAFEEAWFGINLLTYFCQMLSAVERLQFMILNYWKIYVGHPSPNLPN